MRLIIAEKPSVAKAIAAVIGGESKADGHIRCADAHGTTVTWAYGHLLSLAKPEHYAGGRVEIHHLPLIPASFVKQPRDDDAGKQLKVIDGLLKKADSVVNAGDPDREGQLLIDEILESCGWHGKTQRLWLAAVDPESVRNALAALKDNADMQALSASAECRSAADWLTGFNASIALSRRVQAAGGTEALSIGRVQTPTLSLLVRREDELAGFSKRHYYTVSGHIESGIKSTWRMPEGQDGLSDDGLLLDKNAADAVAKQVTGAPAAVTDFKVKMGSKAAPLPHSLSSLQKEASAKYGLSAAKTLAAAQGLYTAGITSYPRTDCRYLPAEQFSAAAGILSKLDIPGASEADTALKHAAWDTSKIEAHHAIIPTGATLSASASPDQRQLFGLIALSYVRLFHPPEKFETRDASFDISGLVFAAKSRTTIEPGWTKLGGGDDEDEPADAGTSAGRLPDLTIGQQLMCQRGEVEARETKPPKAYNDGALISAMTRVHALVDDPKLKARLKETAGLGTEATRAGVIETLIARGLAERSGKDIRATAKGKALIKTVKAVYPALADVGTTAVWEEYLADVAAGRLSAERFMAGQADAVQKMTAAILGAADIGGMAPKPSGQNCPACQSPLVDRTSKKGFKFFACGACGAGFFREKDGRPGAKLGEPSARTPEAEGPACPACKAPTGKFSTAKGNPYYRCASAGHGAWWPDKSDEAKLGPKWEEQKTPEKSKAGVGKR